MAKQVQMVRGNTAAANAYTGLQGQIYYVTDTGELRLHDGVTLGGIRILTKTQNDAAYLGAAGAIAPAGVVSLLAGAVGAPELIFAGDGTTGWYRTGANQWGFSAGGVLVATLAAGGLTLATPLAAGNIAGGTVGKAVLASADQAAFETAVGISKLRVNAILATLSGFGSTAVTIPVDNTIPQIGEGTEILTATITPQSAANKLKITVSGMFGMNGASEAMVFALFQDATANAFKATAEVAQIGEVRNVTIVHEIVAGVAIPTTIRLRVGRQTSGTISWNGSSGAVFGASSAVQMFLEEKTP